MKMQSFGTFVFVVASVLPITSHAATSLMKSKAMATKLLGHSLAASDKDARASAKKVKDMMIDQPGGRELECQDGMIAGVIPCNNINLVSFMTGEDLGSPYASETDPVFFATYVSKQAVVREYDRKLRPILLMILNILISNVLVYTRT